MRANISKQWGAEFGASSHLDAVLLWQKAITGCVNGECKWPAEGTHRENPTVCVAPSLAFTRFSPDVVPQSSLGQFSSDLQEAGRGQQQPSSLCACRRHARVTQASPSTGCEQSRLFLSTVTGPWIQNLLLKRGPSTVWNLDVHRAAC